MKAIIALALSLALSSVASAAMVSTAVLADAVIQLGDAQDVALCGRGYIGVVEFTDGKASLPLCWTTATYSTGDVVILMIPGAETLYAVPMKYFNPSVPVGDKDPVPVEVESVVTPIKG